jgi:hypothetical protein
VNKPKPKPEASPEPDSAVDPEALRAFEEAARKLLAGKPSRKRGRGPKTRRGKGS